MRSPRMPLRSCRTSCRHPSSKALRWKRGAVMPRANSARRALDAANAASSEAMSAGIARSGSTNGRRRKRSSRCGLRSQGCASRSTGRRCSGSSASRVITHCIRPGDSIDVIATDSGTTTCACSPACSTSTMTGRLATVVPYASSSMRAKAGTSCRLRVRLFAFAPRATSTKCSPPSASVLQSRVGSCDANRPMPQKLVIATRQSALALWQAEHVRDRLRAVLPGCTIELLGLTTQGDRTLDQPLADLGGKGLFIKELEQAMADGRADLAAHSLKDVPMDVPQGFTLAAIMAREDPRDAFVSAKYRSLDELPLGSSVGTS